MMEESSSLVQSYSSEMEESFDIGDIKVQHYGLLMKTPFGQKSHTKWQKRFFIVKEGFLLYYKESESKIYEEHHHFNIHPKGIVPLGGCKVEQTVNGPQKYAIKITNSNFKCDIWVGAETNDDAVNWVKALQEASILYKRLNKKASELELEKERKKKLEEQISRLAAKNISIEDAAKNLRLGKDTTEQKLQQTLECMQHIRVEKETLSKKTEDLEKNLQSVSKEQEKTAAELQERERIAKEFEEEKKKLEDVTINLKGNLTLLEEKQMIIENEKIAIEEKLKIQEQTAKQFEHEKQQISDTALSLKANLELTETKWKDEKKRRINTEKQLRQAEDSLKRLDKALRESGIQIDLQIETDVKNLKEFFEGCIEEEQYKAQKLDIMRDAVRAKASYDQQTEKLNGHSSDSCELSPLPVDDQPPHTT